MGVNADSLSLTKSSSSVTQATRARFDSLLEAALNPVINTDREIIGTPTHNSKSIEGRLLPKQLHTSHLKQRNSHCGDEFPSTLSISSEVKLMPEPHKRKMMLHRVEVHSSTTSKCRTSSEEEAGASCHTTNTIVKKKVRNKNRLVKAVVESTLTVGDDKLKGVYDEIEELPSSDETYVITKGCIESKMGKTIKEVVAKRPVLSRSPELVTPCSTPSSTPDPMSPTIHSSDLQTPLLRTADVKVPVSQTLDHHKTETIEHCDSFDHELECPDSRSPVLSIPELFATEVRPISGISTPKTPVPLPRRKKPNAETVCSRFESEKACKSLSVGDQVLEMNEESTVSSPRKWRHCHSESQDIDDDGDDRNLLLRTKMKKQKKKKKRGTRSQQRKEEMEMRTMHPDKQETEAEEEIAVTRETSMIADRHVEMLAVTVHHSDYLRDASPSLPLMVRIHIVDADNGGYLKKSCPLRPASFYHENTDYIPPVMTHPFSFVQNRSMTPCWEETVVFNESVTHVVRPATILFFEVVQLTAGVAATKTATRCLAWAFLKPVASNGAVNTGHRLRLQLYAPRHNIPTDQCKSIVQVYNWWSSGHSAKCPGTLYVTLTSVTPPEQTPTASLRSRTVLQPEMGSARSIRSVRSALGSNNGDGHAAQTLDEAEPAVDEELQPVVWSRLPGQSCHLPTAQLSATLATGCGCSCLQFSHAGRLLAAATTTGAVLLYRVPEGTLHATLSGHRGHIYSIAWSEDDCCLVSASADCTAAIWDKNRSTPKHVLSHPSFVYCAIFVPGCHRAILTGCCDMLVRLWTSHDGDEEYHTAQELCGHAGYVNAICFTVGVVRQLVSGDSEGLIILWDLHTESGRFALSRVVSLRDLRGVTINQLVAHPGGNRLLVHTRDSLLRMVDLETGAPIQWFQGCANERVQSGSCLSPCGGLVLAGSCDGLVYAWESHTGRALAVYTGMFGAWPGGETLPVSVHYHPYDHIAAFAAHSPAHLVTPLQICRYDRNASGEEIGLKFVEPSLEGEFRPKIRRGEEDNAFWKRLEMLTTTQRILARMPVSPTPESLKITSKGEKKSHDTANGSRGSSTFQSDNTSGETNYAFKPEFTDHHWPRLSKLDNLLTTDTDMGASNPFTDPRLADIIYRMDRVLGHVNT